MSRTLRTTHPRHEGTAHPRHEGTATQPAQRAPAISRSRRQVVLAVGTALLAVTATAGCTPEAAEPSGTASSAASTSTPATATTAAIPLLRDQEGAETLAPGRYIVNPINGVSSAPMAPVLTVPEGFGSAGDAVLTEEDIGDGGIVLWVWDVQSVYTHPCDDGGTAEPVGPSVAALAEALAAQPMRDGTEPSAVTIGGYDGLYVELSRPDDLDLATCREDAFHTWPGRSDTNEESVDLLWIIDVDGQRITFNVWHGATAASERVDKVTDMVTTATFVRREDT